MGEVRISLRSGQDGDVAVRVGDVLAVELPENPTTGYVWSVIALPGELAELPADAGADQRAAAGHTAGPGAAAGRTLRFAAHHAGTGELRLRHARSWQPAAGEELVVAVRVEADS